MVVTGPAIAGVLLYCIFAFTRFVDATAESYPIEGPFKNVKLLIGIYAPTDDSTYDTQPSNFPDDPYDSERIEMIGFSSDDDETIEYIETIDPNMEEVIVDEWTEIIDLPQVNDPRSAENEESEPDPTQFERAVGIPDSTEPDVADEMIETIDLPDESDDETLPGTVDTENAQAADEFDSTESGVKPVPDVPTKRIMYLPSGPLPDMPGRDVLQELVSVDFMRERWPTDEEKERYFRAILGFTAFSEPHDVWSAIYNKSPPLDDLKCFFTTVPIQEMPELFHHGQPSAADIREGRATKPFAPGYMHPSVKGATGVGCTALEAKPERKGFLDRFRGSS